MFESYDKNSYVEVIISGGLIVCALQGERD